MACLEDRSGLSETDLHIDTARRIEQFPGFVAGIGVADGGVGPFHREQVRVLGDVLVPLRM
jgi:hypothetical protein